MYLIFCSIMGQFNPEWIGGIEVHVPFAYAVSFLLLICPSLFFPRFFNIAIYFMVVLYLSYGGRDMLQSIRLVIILSLIWYILLTLANSVYSIKRLLGDRKIYERLLKIIATLISLFLSNKLGGWLESKGIRQVLEEIWTQYTLAFIAINYLSLSFFEIKVYQSKKKARDIYKKLVQQESVNYVELRDCAFYGGEEYRDRIFCNRKYVEIIRQEEMSNLHSSIIEVFGKAKGQSYQAANRGSKWPNFDLAFPGKVFNKVKVDGQAASFQFCDWQLGKSDLNYEVTAIYVREDGKHVIAFVNRQNHDYILEATVQPDQDDQVSFQTTQNPDLMSSFDKIIKMT